MVVLSKNIKDLSPEERIKRLRELEEEKKKELAKKRKELEELEKKAREEEEHHRREIEETENLILKSIQDLQEEEEHAFKEQETARKEKNRQNASSIDQLVEQQPQQNIPFGNIYGKALEEIRPDAGFYEVTDYNIVNAVAGLAKKSAYEILSSEEQESLENIRRSLESMENNSYYQQKDNSRYLEKLNSMIDRIDQNARKLSAAEKKAEDELLQQSLYQK